MNATPLGPSTAEARIADLLRERILAGDLPIGAHLRQVDISEEFGVSITPVREAFRSLAAEGLVQIGTHRGVVVRALSPTELLEVYELQLLIEKENLAYAVPQMTEQALLDATAAQDKMRSTAGAGPWALLNRDFHLSLASAAARPRTQSLLSGLLNLTAMSIRGDISGLVGRREQALAEHDGILAAARAGDVSEAQRILHVHTMLPIGNLRRDLACGAG